MRQRFKGRDQIYGTVSVSHRRYICTVNTGVPISQILTIFCRNPRVVNLRKYFGLVSREQTDDIDQIYLRRFSTASNRGPSRSIWRQIQKISLLWGGVGPGCLCQRGRAILIPIRQVKIRPPFDNILPPTRLVLSRIESILYCVSATFQ